MNFFENIKSAVFLIDYFIDTPAIEKIEPAISSIRDLSTATDEDMKAAVQTHVPHNEHESGKSIKRALDLYVDIGEMIFLLGEIDTEMMEIYHYFGMSGDEYESTIGKIEQRRAEVEQILSKWKIGPDSRLPDTLLGFPVVEVENKIESLDIKFMR